MASKTRVFEVRSSEGVYNLVVAKDGVVREVIPRDAESEFLGREYHTVLKGLRKTDPFLKESFVAVFS